MVVGTEGVSNTHTDISDCSVLVTDPHTLLGKPDSDTVDLGKAQEPRSRLLAPGAHLPGNKDLRGSGT